ncbi:MAG: hypothetical protein PHN75_00585 [Syntrophales bacterium]|nr:hypothetical protein [Syntrophales bacterium]
MKINNKLILTLLIVVSCCCVSSCKTTYKTIRQPSVESAAIKTATEFKVRAIDFSEIRSEDLGYSKEKEWKDDLEYVNKAFADACLSASGMKRGNVSRPQYNIVMLKREASATSGIVVTVSVQNIFQKWNYFDNKPDELLCKVTFTDSSNNKELFSASVIVNSRQEMVYVGGNRGYFPSQGLFPVGPGLSFSGRLKAAAENLVEVLITIMELGIIEPPNG